MRLSLGEWQIRSWDTGDVEALARYANDRDVWINLRDTFPHPYTEEDARAWVREARALDPEVAFALASEREAIGGIGLTLGRDVFRHSAEIGYWLGQPFWGLGIATRAVRAFTEFAFANFDLARIYGGVFAWNPASARVLEKAGYSFEGRLRKSVTKNGNIIDLLVYAIIRE